MRLTTTLAVCLMLFFITACKEKSTNIVSEESKLLKKENELLKKENELIIREQNLREETRQLATHQTNNISSNKNIDINEDVIEKKFESYLSKLEGNNLSCYTVNIIIGDLNNDGINDGLVHYSCGPTDGGNIAVELGWIVWLNNSSELDFWIRDSNFKGVPERITSDGTIITSQYDYKDSDPRCCPSIKQTKKYKLKRKQFVEVM